jgi:hypothetical protein
MEISVLGCFERYAHGPFAQGSLGKRRAERDSDISNHRLFAPPGKVRQVKFVWSFQD